MISKLLITILLSITILNAYTFEEFQNICNDVGVQKGVADLGKSKAKAIDRATKNAGIELNKVFNGVVINSDYEKNRIRTVVNDTMNLTKTIKDYSTEQSSGNIFYERVGYKQIGNLIEVKAKLTCSKKMYDAIQDAILQKVFSKEKVCVISKHNDSFSDIAIDEINEYLLNNQKNIKLYRCDTNNRDKLKQDHFTKIFIIKLENKKIKIDIGYQLISKITRSFENLSDNQLYGTIKLKCSKFTQTTDNDIINEMYEVNIKSVIQKNIKNLLLQIKNTGRK